MKYHDFKLRGYSVADAGASIVLFLAYDYPERPLRESNIKFSDVALYQFVHTQPAIIYFIVGPSDNAKPQHA